MMCGGETPSTRQLATPDKRSMLAEDGETNRERCGIGIWRFALVGTELRVQVEPLLITDFTNRRGLKFMEKETNRTQLQFGR